MSHLSKVHTEFRDLLALKAAVASMGFGWSPQGQCRGWGGAKTTFPVVIKLPVNYDIGVSITADGMELSADLYDGSVERTVGTGLGLLKQAYAREKLISEARRKGKTVRVNHLKGGVIELLIGG